MDDRVFYFTDADFARVARNSAIDDFSWPQSALELEGNSVIVMDPHLVGAFREHVLEYYPDWLEPNSP